MLFSFLVNPAERSGYQCQLDFQMRVGGLQNGLKHRGEKGTVKEHPSFLFSIDYYFGTVLRVTY